VHGFDTSLESCEDVDLCNRLRAAELLQVSQKIFLTKLKEYGLESA